MNGEIEQMSNIVISARKAIYENKEIEFVPREFILSIKFVFLRKLFALKAHKVDSVQKWFDICKKQRLCDMKFIIPTTTNHRHLLGFSNTSRGVIVCFWQNGKVTCFSPAWEFDSRRNGWNVVYREQPEIGIRKKETTFADRTEEFKKTLSDIGKFATDMGFRDYSDVFHRAYEALCDDSLIDPNHVPAQVPDEFKGIYYAVETADVFGGMGSWNDSPPCYAHEMGMDKEYNELSDRLLQQIRYHLMYIVNECWQGIDKF